VALAPGEYTGGKKKTMANKLSRAMNLLETALGALVTSGDLKAVKRTIINPLMAMQKPVLGLKIVRYGRTGGTTWTADVCLTLVTTAGEGGDDERNIDLAAKVDDCIKAHVASGTALAKMDSPTWEPWEWRDKADGPLMPIGSSGGLKLSVEDPLLL
jgi:hypothetical protein